MVRGEGREPRGDCRRGRAGAARAEIGVQEHRLHRRGERAVAAGDAVEEMEPLARAAQHLRRDGDPVARADLGEISDMVLDREVAVARRDIGSVGSDQLHQAVGGETAGLEIVVRTHVAVVVAPCGRDLPAERDGKPLSFGERQPCLVGGEHGSGAAADVPERA